MTCGHRLQLEAADAELDSARAALVVALDSPLDDEMATARISSAVARLRAAQARQEAARSDARRLPDLVRSG